MRLACPVWKEIWGQWAPEDCRATMASLAEKVNLAIQALVVQRANEATMATLDLLGNRVMWGPRVSLASKVSMVYLAQTDFLEDQAIPAIMAYLGFQVREGRTDNQGFRVFQETQGYLELPAGRGTVQVVSQEQKVCQASTETPVFLDKQESLDNKGWTAILELKELKATQDFPVREAYLATRDFREVQDLMEFLASTEKKDCQVYQANKDVKEAQAFVEKMANQALLGSLAWMENQESRACLDSMVMREVLDLVVSLESKERLVGQATMGCLAKMVHLATMALKVSLAIGGLETMANRANRVSEETQATLERMADQVNQAVMAPLDCQECQENQAVQDQVVVTADQEALDPLATTETADGKETPVHLAIQVCQVQTVAGAV